MGICERDSGNKIEKWGIFSFSFLLFLLFLFLWEEKRKSFAWKQTFSWCTRMYCRVSVKASRRCPLVSHKSSAVATLQCYERSHSSPCSWKGVSKNGKRKGSRCKPWEHSSWAAPSTSLCWFRRVCLAFDDVTQRIYIYILLFFFFPLFFFPPTLLSLFGEKSLCRKRLTEERKRKGGRNKGERKRI